MNFLSDTIRGAVDYRLQHRQKGQQVNEVRLNTDLLSSMPMCFNLFGELWNNAEATRRTGQRLFGVDSPASAEVRFEWSPGRSDPRYTNDRTAFDAALIFDEKGPAPYVVGIETKYHEHATVEATPKDNRLPRYRQITEASGCFRDGWEELVLGTELQQIWRDHLLVLSMLQDPSRDWSGGKYVLVHPGQNPSFAEVGKRYQEVLNDDSTYAVMTVEDLLDAHCLHPESVEQAFRDRYLW